VVPLIVLLAGGALAFGIVRKWPRRGAQAKPQGAGTAVQESAKEKSEYDRRLDEELRALDD
jgi:hypothetical protein